MADTPNDPFDDFNRAHALGVVRDPYPRLAELRGEGSVCKGSLRGMFGQPEVPAEVGSYSVLTHDAATRVLLDGDTFSSAGYAQSVGPVFGHSILEMDEPEHSRYRGLIQKAFTKSALDRWEHELVRPIVNRMIDQFADRGRADLVRELTFPFPVAVIAGMIGVDEADLPAFHRMATEVLNIAADPVRGVRASQGLRELFSRVLVERRAAPRADLTSVLATAELDGTRLDDEAIYAFLRLLAPAGAETTYRSLGNLLLGLFQHPDQLDALRADRALMPQAIEEGLRWEPPLLNISRTTTREVEVDGVVLPAGTMVNVNLGAANRDEARFADPEGFDIFRPQKTNVAFATGAHRCLGLHLARMESTVALNALLDRLPGLRLDPAAEDVHISGVTFRSPLALPVVFDPAGRRTSGVA
ncbi:MAG TPA: cytochrome P450 [Kofleriaceae bacterium]|nr:cytochrome P450 [Kofleriaceae bacterium]